MISGKRKQQNREAQQRHRDKELEMRKKKEGPYTLYLCEECKEWKDEDDFPVRGRGRGKMCLECCACFKTETPTKTTEQLVETEKEEKLRKFAESPAGQKMMARREEMVRKYGFDE